MEKEFIPYAKQSINNSDIAAVTDALKTEFITRGPLVDEFERAIADYCGAKYAVAFSNASTALLSSCKAANVCQKDRFICTPNTFVTSVSAGVHCGATPVFVDIDLQNGGMNLEQVAFNLERPYTTGRPVIMPVHYAGIPVDMPKLDGILKDPNVVIIEDAAHAIGSRYSDGQRVGSCAFSQMTVFSFHPAKTMTTGEGGMVTTNDEGLYNRLRILRNSGIERAPERMQEQASPWYYEVQEFSNNFNITSFQAALGLNQLKRIENFIEKRRLLISQYRKRLSSFPKIRLFNDQYDADTAYHLCIAQIDYTACRTTRERVMMELQNRGIGTQVHYIPVYRHPCFKRISGDLQTYFPKMEEFYSKALSLPLYYDLTVDQVNYVCDSLLSILKSGR